MPSRSGHILVTFSNDGHLDYAAMTEPQFDDGDDTWRCILAEFRTARVPPFDGPAPPIETSFRFGTDWISTSAPFDRGEAVRAIGDVDLRPCKTAAGPTGSGRVTLTFVNSGRVVAVKLDGGPFPKTPVGDCISKMFRNVRVPIFAGPPAHVEGSFAIQ